MVNRDSNEIRKWQEDVAQGRTPSKKLVYDPETKQFKTVDSNSYSPDETTEVKPEEARRFSTHALIGDPKK